MIYRIILLVALITSAFACSDPKSNVVNDSSIEPDQPYIVFVTGDEEYRSEESMPMLAKLAERELGARTRVLFAVDSAGYVDPNRNDHIEGLEALDSANMMVCFLRWRQLPADEAQHILDFAESGKPMVGFRTSTHTFKYEDDDAERVHLNNDWPTAVWGQQWIVHHGHFDDGHDPLTSVSIVENPDNAAILNGVEPFEAYSWLYHVDGGAWNINPNTQWLLKGRSLRSKQEAAGKLDEYPLENPVAWTNTYKGAPVFFTTLGHPYDWKNDNMRRLALNGMAWALKKDIPPTGFNAELIGTYDPNNSGFGDKFKQDRRPEDFLK